MPHTPGERPCKRWSLQQPHHAHDFDHTDGWATCPGWGQPLTEQRLTDLLRVLDLIQEEHDHQPKFFKANYEMHAPRLLEIAQSLRAELQAERARTGRRRRATQTARNRRPSASAPSWPELDQPRDRTLTEGANGLREYAEALADGDPRIPGLLDAVHVLLAARTARPGCPDPIECDHEAELGHLRTQLAQQDNALNWQTNCLSCANLLNACYAETTRAETAEARLATVRDFANRDQNGLCCSHITGELRRLLDS